MTSYTERRERDDARNALSERLKALAICEYESEDIEVDDAPELSEGADGIWVQAWVFLSNSRLAKEGIENAEAQYDESATCDGCNATWDVDDLPAVTDLAQRVAPGEPMPAGECPACGAVCHIDED
jgi:hypothetical protein